MIMFSCYCCTKLYWIHFD